MEYLTIVYKKKGLNQKQNQEKNMTKTIDK